MRKFLFLTLVFLLLGAVIVSCGPKGPVVLTEDALKGTWEVSVPLDSQKLSTFSTAFGGLSSSPIGGMTDALPEAFSEGMDIDFKSFFRFEDGEVQLCLKRADFVSMYDQTVDFTLEILKGDEIYRVFEAVGMDRESVEALLSMSGMTMEQLISTVEEQMPSGDDLFDLLADEMDAEEDADGVLVVQIGTYTLEDGVLTLVLDGVEVSFPCTFDGEKSIQLGTLEQEGQAATLSELYSGATMIKVA